MKITVKGGDMSPEEQQKYVDYLESKYPNLEFTELELSIEKDENNEEEFVDMKYVCQNKKETNVPYNRVRRITGYLVHDLSKWNDAKRAEEKDRVKHTSMSCGCDIGKVE